MVAKPADAKPTLLYSLLPRLAQPYASSTLEGLLPCRQLTRGSQTFKLDEGISYALTLTNAGDLIVLMGTVYAAGVTECARCLEDAAFEVSGEVGASFVLNSKRDDIQPADDEFMTVEPGGVVDLAVPVVAAIIFELPQVLLCKEDCAGLCPVCGANLNERRCDCAEQAPSETPFALLRELWEPPESGTE
jgi:uncharacterized protein